MALLRSLRSSPSLVSLSRLYSLFLHLSFCFHNLFMCDLFVDDDDDDDDGDDDDDDDNDDHG